MFWTSILGPADGRLKLDWSARQKICIGIAKGLTFLHEESTLKVVHRDIKATNVLLDRDLNPKISDFGLAKLDEEENTHISTKIAGTMWVTVLSFASSLLPSRLFFPYCLLFHHICRPCLWGIVNRCWSDRSLVLSCSSERILEYDSNEISALKTSRENTVSRVFAKSLTKFCVFGNC